MLTPEEKALLEELGACGNEINDSEYTEDQRKLLRELEKKRLVDLRWVLTSKGRNEKL